MTIAQQITPATVDAPISANPTSARYESLDAWRGIACLAVVAFHASAPLCGENTWLQSLPLYQVILHGGLGIHLFFVISGYCVVAAAVYSLQRGRGVGSYAVARVRRIFPPYWISIAPPLLAYFALLYVTRHGMGAPTSHILSGGTDLLRPGPLLSNLLLMQVPFGVDSIVGVAWTLSYEVVFYAIVAVFMLISYSAARIRGMLDGLHVLTMACLVILIVAPRLAVFPFDFWPEFGFGILVYDLTANPNRRMTWLLAALNAALMAGLMISVSMHGRFGYGHDGGLDSCGITLGFSILIVLLFTQDRRLMQLSPVKALAWLGTFSYGLYLTHLTVVGAVLWSFKRAHLEKSHHYMLVGASILLAVACGYVFSRYCEWPFMSRRRSAANERR